MRIFLILVICISFNAKSQSNTTLLGHLDLSNTHSTEMNDIWGYTDEFDNEYALVGTQDGTSIVDVTDGANPVEIYWLPGMNSTWRDLKVYNDFAYVTTEALEGLLILDLTSLPTASGITASYFNGPVANEWQSAHNLYIDESGFLYIFGANRGIGGVIVYDLNSSPTNPTEVSDLDDWYVHDGFVQNDTGYFGNIYEGQLSVWNVADKNNPLLISTALTPTTFTHNIWANTSGFAFTTDEVAGGYIGAYDLSNPSNPVLIDKIQSSPGDNIIPHNAHVLDDYLITSYYADGVVIHDISRPHNMVEVAQYDTSPIHSEDFVGCWGVYPFFSSGKIIASDIEEGLFVIDASLHKGSYLEGNVTEQGTGFNVGNVSVSIDGTTISDNSNIFGDYATGIDFVGTNDVTFFKVLYYPQTISVDFQEGIVNFQDVVLEKIPQYSVTLKVLDAVTNLPIENANISLEHTYVEHTGVSDANGELILDIYYQDVYQLSAGKWGNITSCFSDTLITASTGSIEIYLETGLYDDFTFDFGWDTIHTGSKEGWVREIPVGVIKNGTISNPFSEISWDCGKYAFITGNGSEVSNSEEINDGEAILFSPLMDLTSYTNPHINYAIWYFNKFGAVPDDTLFIYMDNGIDHVLIDYFDPETTTMGQWLGNSVSLNDKITLTANMQLEVYISDYITSENITEAAFDFFSVTDYSVLSDEEKGSVDNDITVFPNPFNDKLILSEGNLSVKIYNFSGQLMLESSNEKEISTGRLQSGIYLIHISNNKGESLLVEKLIKL
jgi:choice-of-anchor B domain-containing protein